MCSTLKLLPSLILVGGLMGACDNDSSGEAREKKMEDYAKSFGVDADVDYSAEDGVKSVTVNNAAGVTAQMGADVGLPSDFPNDIALYPQMKIVVSSKAPQGYVVQAQTPDNVDKVAAFYAAEMAAKGWTQTQEAKTGTIRALTFTKEGHNANVSLMGGDQGTTVQLSTFAG